ncbi:ABC transporter permease [Paenibacillus sp. 19GGS1-52]|uniref:ABC transporter permease n=1 Tax=Paenibacillus sp. 19GGS1-52 TaxID=2758563 RepID=UPI001EFC1CA1|nr:ABC transporter permease [Paenibacillus sp. 19GGS1-52]ULO05973.1 ABC transporter permease [Paenibacillus sp. 19GGS1-52]
MLKLIALEIRKNKLLGMLKGVLIANLAILAFMILVVFIDQSESDSFVSYTDVFEGIYVFIKATYIIFAAILLSKLVIEEYKNNTITLLFMYPISRKKLMTAKLIIVFLFTLVNIVVADIVIGGILVGINYFINIVPGQLTLSMLSVELVKVGTSAVYAAGIGLIPLYFGMRKKSVPTTIVAAVLLVSLISSGFDEFRLGNMAAVSIVLAVVGMFIAYLSIRNVETADID